MTTEITEVVEQASYLSMPDDEISSASPPRVDQEVATPIAEERTESADTSGETTEETSTYVPVEKQEITDVDYKAEYHRILTPFKANGKDVAVGSVDDAISLMQMGANYNKKMAALKPNLKLMKLLENNGMLNEAKLSYLIDLEKKNPAAIQRLVKDSGIDPIDFDSETANGYTPNTYRVDDLEMELDSVLDEIQDTPTYSRTLDIVSKQWDGASKNTVAASPQLLKVLNNHVQSGMYDIILKEMDNERMYGRLDGLSDFDAYRKTGDAVNARGGFNQLGHQGKSTNAAVTGSTKPQADTDTVLKDKKRAASSTRPSAVGQSNKDFNPLSMSDEEFSKMATTKYR